MTFEVIDHLSEVSRDEFDALDGTAGAAGCFDRLQQRELDTRWRTRYLRWSTPDGVKAVVPLYLPRGRLADRAYDPSTWPDGPPDPAGQDYVTALFVGGVADLRTSLHVARDHRARPDMSRLLSALVEVATSFDRTSIVFPYVFEETKQCLSDAADQIAWCTLEREAHYLDVADGDWIERQSSKVRYVLRRDQRLIAAAGAAVTTASWPDVEDYAAQLIAEHNTRMGGNDHPEFVRMRHREWMECTEVDLTVFVLSGPGAPGVLTAILWRGELELYEIGLAPSVGAARLASYIALLFQAPMAFARSHDVRAIRAGVAAAVPKASRGATFRTLFGGVLPLSDTPETS
jgi:hypothetical protein